MAHDITKSDTHNFYPFIIRDTFFMSKNGHILTAFASITKNSILAVLVIAINFILLERKIL